MTRNPDPMRPMSHGTILPATAPLYPIELHRRRERRRCAVVAFAVLGTCFMFAALVLGGVG